LLEIKSLFKVNNTSVNSVVLFKYFFGLIMGISDKMEKLGIMENDVTEAVALAKKKKRKKDKAEQRE